MQSKSMGKCPKCGQIANNLVSGHVLLNVPAGRQWNGISHNCPHCQTILGVEIDPIALKSDIVDELFAKLRAT